MEEVVIDLILGMLGIPSFDKLRKLIKRHKSKIDVLLVYKDRKPDSIMKVLKEFNHIVNIREDKDLPSGVKELYPITIIYGLFNGRLRIYGDMPGLLSYVFGEILGLASGILESEVPREILRELKEKIRGEINITIFVVPGIPCVRTCHMFSHIASRINKIYIEIIDADTHQEYFEEKYSNGSLPLIIINNKIKRTGSPRNYREILTLLRKTLDINEL